MLVACEKRLPVRGQVNVTASEMSNSKKNATISSTGSWWERGITPIATQRSKSEAIGGMGIHFRQLLNRSAVLGAIVIGQGLNLFCFLEVCRNRRRIRAERAVLVAGNACLML